jgi:hypothetical protein
MARLLSFQPGLLSFENKPRKARKTDFLVGLANGSDNKSMPCRFIGTVTELDEPAELNYHHRRPRYFRAAHVSKAFRKSKAKSECTPQNKSPFSAGRLLPVNPSILNS